MPQRVIPQIASGHGVLWPGIRVELSVASTFFRPPSSSLQQWLAFRDAHRSLEEPAVKGGWPHVRGPPSGHLAAHRWEPKLKVSRTGASHP